MVTSEALDWSVIEDRAAQGADFSAGRISIRDRALPTQRYALRCLAT